MPHSLSITSVSSISAISFALIWLKSSTSLSQLFTQKALYSLRERSSISSFFLSNSRSSSDSSDICISIGTQKNMQSIAGNIFVNADGTSNAPFCVTERKRCQMQVQVSKVSGASEYTVNICTGTP